MPLEALEGLLSHRIFECPVLADPIGALAHLQQRAHVLPGDRNGGTAEYQEFFTLRKNANTNLPILRQAKFEYGKLRCEELRA